MSERRVRGDGPILPDASNEPERGMCTIAVLAEKGTREVEEGNVAKPLVPSAGRTDS